MTMTSARWPSYFSSPDGQRLSSGSLRADEFPLDFSESWGGEVPIPLPRLLNGLCGIASRFEAHRHARSVAEQRFTKCWKALEAPDGSTYYYDYVSNTWMQSQPTTPMCTASQPSNVDEGRLAGEEEADMADIASRLKQCLQSSLPEARRATATGAAYTSAPLARSVPVPAAAYGGALPTGIVSPEAYRSISLSSVPPSAVSGSGVLPPGSAMVSSGFTDRPPWPPGFTGDADQDVQEAPRTDSHPSYFYNLWTRASYRKRVTAVKETAEFYRDLSYVPRPGPNGATGYWTLSSMGLSDWDLVVLFKQWRDALEKQQLSARKHLVHLQFEPASPDGQQGDLLALTPDNREIARMTVRNPQAGLPGLRPYLAERLQVSEKQLAFVLPGGRRAGPEDESTPLRELCNRPC